VASSSRRKVLGGRNALGERSAAGRAEVACGPVSRAAASRPFPKRRRGSPAVAAALALGLALAACAQPGPVDNGVPSTSGASTVPSPSPSSTATGTPTVKPGDPDALRLEPFTKGLDSPINVTNAGDGSGRLFVNEQAGVIRVLGPDGALRGQPFLDIRARVLSGGERGLLGLAFHPRFPEDPRIFVDYTRVPDGATVIAEYRATAERADPASQRVLLLIPQPFANHNGGQLSFGPDGFLYIGMGDGGSGGDPFGNGQNPRALLGKLLRIDVDSAPASGKAYAIPGDNPFAAGGVRPGAGAPEVWAFGLRNPWRFSFDAANRDLYIGDVGQAAWEEIDRQPGGSRGGENYGWNVMEGDHCFRSGCDERPYVKPIAEYGHAQGCAVIGGYVYRGKQQPILSGVYVFADDCSGIVFTLQVDTGRIAPKVVLDSGQSISSFGVGENGEIYAADLGGGIWRVIAG
jgi:glucose/arabinose dehydrogenase